MNAIIAWMVRNRVAANLLMVFIIAAGLLSAAVITVQLFPDIELARLEIRVEYPGASPAEIEESIVKPIEEAVQSVEGIREIIGADSIGYLSLEGLHNVSKSLKLGYCDACFSDNYPIPISREGPPPQLSLFREIEEGGS